MKNYITITNNLKAKDDFGPYLQVTTNALNTETVILKQGQSVGVNTTNITLNWVTLLVANVEENNG